MKKTKQAPIGQEIDTVRRYDVFRANDFVNGNIPRYLLIVKILRANGQTITDAYNQRLYI